MKPSKGKLTSGSPLDAAMKMLGKPQINSENPNTKKGNDIDKVNQAIDLLEDAADKYPQLARYIEALQSVVAKVTNEKPDEEEDEE